VRSLALAIFVLLSSTATTLAAARPGPIGKDLSWAVDVDTQAERRVLELHALHPAATHVYLPRARSTAAESIAIHQLANVYQVPVNDRDCKWVLTLSDGRVLEHRGRIELRGATPRVTVTEFERYGVTASAAEIGAWRVAELRKLKRRANRVIGQMPYAGEKRIPLSRIAEFEAYSVGPRHGGFMLVDVDGQKHNLLSISVASSNDDKARVWLDRSDPRWWAGGAAVNEPFMPDLSSKLSLLRASLRRLLPSGDRLTNGRAVMPLASVRGIDTRVNGMWVRDKDGSWPASLVLQLTDAKGNAAEVHAQDIRAAATDFSP
jgi:hypothetical protein